MLSFAVTAAQKESKAAKSGIISHIAFLGGKLGQITEIAEI